MWIHDCEHEVGSFEFFQQFPDAGRSFVTRSGKDRSLRVLSVWRLDREQADWIAQEFDWALGRLEGHLNRHSDGPPGWQTLWRGQHKLRFIPEFDQRSTAT